MKQTLLSLFLLVASSLALAAQDLPNILWITSEDNGPHLGCYGDNYAVTPNLDGLAEKGMRYTNASSTAPVCAPARTTIISGIYPPATGGQHMRSMVPMPKGTRMYPEFLKDLGYYCTNVTKEDYNLKKPADLWHGGGKKDTWKNRDEGQPFFAIFNHTISHESQIRNQISPEDQFHDPAGVRVPAYHPDTPEVRKDWAQYYDRLTMMDKLAGKNLEELEEAGVDENTIIFYYGDHGSGMPRSKRWPYVSGLNVPFIVYFPEKWKHLAPDDYEEGGVSDRLIGFIDLAPTLLSMTGQKPPEWMQGHAFAGKYQTEAPGFSFGFRGRMDERIDMVRTVRNERYNYIRNYMPHKPWGQFIQYMFQTPTTQVWKEMYLEGELNEAQAMFWQTKPAEELYDLEADPDEVNNLADSPDHADILQKMRDAHAEHVLSIRDLGFLPEAMFQARSEGMAPYDMGHDPEKYNLEEIFPAAQVATSLDPEALPEIVSFLDSEEEAIRYWGAIGLLTQAEAGFAAGADELRAALKDASPMVAITAAEAVGRYGTEEDASAALEVLLSYAEPSQSAYVGIAAWNALDYLDERVRPVRDQIEALSPTPNDPPERVGKYSEALKKRILVELDGES